MTKEIILIPGGTLELKNNIVRGSAIVKRASGRREMVGMDARLTAAAYLYACNPHNTRIVVAGRKQIQFANHHEDHSAILAIQKLKRRFNISQEHIVAVDSCNGATYGDMQAMVLYLQSVTGDNVRITLLTSQFHLPRAYMMFMDVYHRANGKLLCDCLSEKEREKIIASLLNNYSEQKNGELAFIRDMLQPIYKKYHCDDLRMSTVSAEEVLIASHQAKLQRYGRQSLMHFYNANVRQGEYSGIAHLIDGTYDVHVGSWTLKQL